MLLLHHRVIHVTILYQSEERQHETKWLTCILRNNMMALPNLEPVVLDLRSNLHLSSHFALKSPKEKRLSTAYFMTCWLCVLFHYNNWILKVLLKLSQAHVSDLCACELMHAASISMMSSLLSFLFTDGLIWPSSTLYNQDMTVYYLWYLTLHNNSWFFFLFRSSQQSIRTLTTGYALSSLFVPGDRHVVVGTKVCQFRWDSFFLLFGQRWERACTSFKSLTWGVAVRVLTFHVGRVKARFH